MGGQPPFAPWPGNVLGKGWLLLRRLQQVGMPLARVSYVTRAKRDGNLAIVAQNWLPVPINTASLRDANDKNEHELFSTAHQPL